MAELNESSPPTFQQRVREALERYRALPGNKKLLLFGGAIQLAGTVKSRKSARHATSDWMEVEKQRGISVTSSVMQFEYQDHTVNLLGLG